LHRSRNLISYAALQYRVPSGIRGELRGRPSFGISDEEESLMTPIRKSLAALAGATLALSTVAASPAMAAPVERSAQSAEETNEIGSKAWIGIIAALLVVALAAIAAFDDNDSPVSP